MGKNNSENVKKIALIAHDNRKEALIQWADEHKGILENHILCGTGTTAKLINEKTGLNVHGFKSGPMGGDQQIGAAIVNGDIDIMIFFWDPLTSQPHDPDVKALLRIAVLYDVIVAMSKSTADFVLSSNKINEEYSRNAIDYYSRIRKDNI